MGGNAIDFFAIYLFAAFFHLHETVRHQAKTCQEAKLVGNLEFWYNIIFVLSERSVFRLYQVMLVLLLNLQAPQKNKPQTVPASSVFKMVFWRWRLFQID